MAEHVDLSQRLDSCLPIYPGDPPFSCCPALTLAKDGVNVHAISMGSHTGTHIDAPYHFVDGGARVDEIPLWRCIGPALVVDVTGKRAREQISWADLQPFEDKMRERTGLSEGLILLIRTGWSRYWGSSAYFDHPYVDRDAATRIVELGVKAIGIDTLSPDMTFTDPDVHGTFDVHHIILGAGGVIAENLANLEKIQEGSWIVSMVPLKLAGCDGSPVRAFATPRAVS
ncbi:putative cyclase [Laetiporus sulphureus 93-53]|uniref:Putative cyclase n=1 Tax=Laetiporus sulphureus 93-53 TaxID=1314785 RepID=A0A165D178_9APHY|nr:putative cyclase [Laetiporus sulphureus 93-53]KZT03936.1 putative cyclase [Laetiporus sulphureus 93-53]